jgi:triacylglycerol lipase
MMGKEIKFHPASFYLGIADMLAREVEGQNQDQVDQHSHEDGEIEKPKVGPGVELEEHPGKPSTGRESTSTSPRPRKPDLIPPRSEEGS